MPKGADYDPPTIELATGPWPIHDALVSKKSDEATVAFLEERLAANSPEDPSW